MECSTKYQVLGALRPTIGNTVGLTTRFSGRYPIKACVFLGPWGCKGLVEQMSWLIGLAPWEF